MRFSAFCHMVAVASVSILKIKRVLYRIENRNEIYWYEGGFPYVLYLNTYI